MRQSGNERRNRIIELLSSASKPISGSELAKMLNVSRQVIVNDIAMLRVTRPDLIATNEGYIMMHASSNRRVFKVNHTNDEMEDELNSIIDLGGIVVDVFIEHKIYGTVSAPLNLSTRRDIRNFLNDLESGVSSPLMNLTKGYHYHTIEARSGEILDEISEMLKEKGYLIEVLDSTTIYEPKKYS